jgi:hypothetical protein
MTRKTSDELAEMIAEWFHVPGVRGGPPRSMGGIPWSSARRAQRVGINRSLTRLPSICAGAYDLNV